MKKNKTICCGKEFDNLRSWGQHRRGRIHQLWEEQEAHPTVSGWCCACEYDIAVMESLIKKASEVGK